MLLYTVKLRKLYKPFLQDNEMKQNKKKPINKHKTASLKNKPINKRKTARLKNKPNTDPIQSKSNRISVHDLYFKSHFSAVEKAKKLLYLVLTPLERELFDWDSLKEEKDSLEENTRADLIFSLGFKSDSKQSIKIYILLEHKSKKDQKAFDQMLFYNNRIIEIEFLKVRSMPGVLNVLFYHGRGAWTGKVAFEERNFKQIVKDEKIMSFLDKVMLEYKVRILDVGQSPEVKAFLKKESEDLVEKKSQMALYVLKQICHLSKREALDAGDTGFLNEVLDYLEGLPFKERSSLLAELILYMERYFQVPKARIEEAIKQTKNYRKEDNMESLLDIYNEDIRQEGIKAGIQKGIETGRQEGRQEGIKTGRQEGIKTGRQEGIHKTALRMLGKNLKPAQISEYTGLSVQQIRRLKKQAKK